VRKDLGTKLNLQGAPFRATRAVTGECNMDMMRFEIWVDLGYNLRSVSDAKNELR
jgi:hypothetical protein